MAAGQEGRQARPLKQFTLCGELLFTTDNGQPICDRHSPCCRLHHLGSQRCFGFPDVRRLGSASRFSIAFSVPGPALGLGYQRVAGLRSCSQPAWAARRAKAELPAANNSQGERRGGSRYGFRGAMNCAHRKGGRHSSTIQERDNLAPFDCEVDVLGHVAGKVGRFHRV
jgi:hypothetical protein